MSFNDFKRKCFDFFEMYKWWSFMSNLRVWETLPGDETEGKTIWYCLWDIRPSVTMMLFYDYGDDSDDLQFVVYVDWKAGAYTRMTHTSVKASSLSWQSTITLNRLWNVCVSNLPSISPTQRRNARLTRYFSIQKTQTMHLALALASLKATRYLKQ